MFITEQLKEINNEQKTFCMNDFLEEKSQIDLLLVIKRYQFPWQRLFLVWQLIEGLQLPIQFN